MGSTLLSVLVTIAMVVTLGAAAPRNPRCIAHDLQSVLEDLKQSTISQDAGLEFEYSAIARNYRFRRQDLRVGTGQNHDTAYLQIRDHLTGEIRTVRVVDIVQDLSLSYHVRARFSDGTERDLWAQELRTSVAVLNPSEIIPDQPSSQGPRSWRMVHDYVPPPSRATLPLRGPKIQRLPAPLQPTQMPEMIRRSYERAQNWGADLEDTEKSDEQIKLDIKVYDHSMQQLTEAAFEALSSRTNFKSFMQNFIAETAALVATTPKWKRIDETRRARLPQGHLDATALTLPRGAMLRVLIDRLERLGFRRLTRVQQRLNSKDFFQVLAQGHLPIDDAFANANHGTITHLLQVAQVGEIIDRDFGPGQTLRLIRYAGQTNKSVWVKTFDALSDRSLHSPEVYYDAVRSILRSDQE